MVRPQLRRAAAALALTSLLSLVPGSASAAVRPHGEHGRTTTSTKARAESRSSGLRRLALLFLEKMAVTIDPNGIAISSPNPDGHR
jgi:hypothetical protein